MKLLEEDEDESMHSGADVEASTAALNGDIEGGSSSSQSLHADISFSQENQTSSQMYSQWQPSSQDENNGKQSHQQSLRSQEQQSSYLEMKEHGSNMETQQEVSASKEPSGSHSHLNTPVQVDGQGHSVEANSGDYSQPPPPVQMQPQISGTGHAHDHESNRMSPSNESRFTNSHRFSNQPVSAPEQTATSSNRTKQIPFGSLLPIILPELDKDKSMQLQTLYTKLRTNEIPKDTFVRHMRTIVGDQMLRLAVVKLQAKLQNPNQQSHPRPPGSSAAQFSDPYSFGQLHQKCHSTPTSDHSSIPVQGVLKQQLQRLHMSFVCKESSGGQRRNSDFSKQNRSVFSRNRNRPTKNVPLLSLSNTLNCLKSRATAASGPREREIVELLRKVRAQLRQRSAVKEEKKSEALKGQNNSDLSKQNRLAFSRNRNRPTKNGPLLSLSNTLKSLATAASGPRDREIVELFRKVQAQLRQRSAVKEEKKSEALKGQNKESETAELLKLLRKHLVEQAKKKVNGGGANDFSLDHPRQSGQSIEDKSRSFFNYTSIVREEPHETNKPSYSWPPSSFKRNSPVPRVKYEPIVSHSDLEVKLNETLTEPDLMPESDSDCDSDMEQEEEANTVLDTEAEFVDGPEGEKLSEAESSDAEEDDYA